MECLRNYRSESKDFRGADDAGEVGTGQTMEDFTGSKNLFLIPKQGKLLKGFSKGG